MSTDLPIVYEDPWLAIVQKPAGMASEAGASGESVLKWFGEYLAKKYPGQKQLSAGLPHRLDKPVSGLLLLTKRRQPLKTLGDYTREHWKKYYLAVLAGTYTGPAHLVHYIEKQNGSLRALAHTQPVPGAKKAELRCHILASSGGTTTVFIELLTGRYHQIRAQFAAAGFPILGDTLYNGGAEVPPAAIALHACKLIFMHPVEQKQMIFHSGYGPVTGFPEHPALSEAMQILSKSVYF